MFRLALFLAAASAACGQPSLSDLLAEKTMADLRRFDEGFDGALGVAAIDLTDGRKTGPPRRYPIPAG